MPVPQEYILSFDLAELENQFSVLNRAYTDFGKTIQDVTSKTKNDLQQIAETVTEINSLLSTVTASLDYTFASLKGNVLETSHMFEDIAKFSKEAADNIQKIGAADLKLGAAGGGQEGVEGRVKDIHAMPLPVFSFDTGGAGSDAQELIELVETAKYVAEQAMKMAKSAKDQAEEMEGTLDKTLKRVKDYIDKEVKSAKGAMGGLMSGASMGVIGGGIMGGLLTAMILGYAEEKRMQQQMGEVINVFEGISGDFNKRMQDKAVGWFSSFQEKAQKFYGIGKAESQAVAKQFVDAGHTREDFNRVFNKELGEVGHNAVTATLGIDKLFNVASGTGMQRVNEMVSMFGEHLDKATDKYIKLAFAAQRSGMGVENFINSVMSGSQAMSQYGIDVKDVANVMQTLQKSYEGMGLEKQFAGGIAGKAVQGMVQGVSNFSDAFKVIIEDMINPEGRTDSGYARKQRFNEGWRKIAEGKDDDNLIRIIKASALYAKRQAPDRASQIEVLQQPGVGYNNLAAQTVIDLSDKLEEGRELDSGTKEQLEAFKKSFQTEGMQLNEIEKRKTEMTYAMRDIGQGLLKILGGLLGAVIGGFRAVIALITTPWGLDPQSTAIRDATFAKITQWGDAVFSNISEGAKDVWGGFGQLKDVLGEGVEDVFGDKSAIQKAIDIPMGIQGDSIKNLAKELGDVVSDVNVLSNLMMQLAKDFGGINPASPFIGMAQDLAKVLKNKPKTGRGTFDGDEYGTPMSKEGGYGQNYNPNWNQSTVKLPASTLKSAINQINKNDVE